MPDTEIVFTVPAASITDACEVLEHWYGLRLTEEQLADLIRTSPLVALEVKDLLDTLGRERLIDHITETVGMGDLSWPINADSAEKSAAFYPSFREKCIAAGYEVLWEPDYVGN